MDEDYIELITVKRFGSRWAIHTFSHKRLKYVVDIRKYKYIAKYVAEGMAIVLGVSNRQRGLPLELQIYNRRGKLKGKNSKQSYGHDSPDIEG